MFYFFVLLFLCTFLTSCNNFGSQLTVDYFLCDKKNGNCVLEAKFKDFLTCNRVNEKSDWICDESDPNNIICKSDQSELAYGYCVNNNK